VIYVCSLQALPFEAERIRPRHVVSLVDPDCQVESPGCVEPANHVRFFFHDIAEPAPGYVAPEERDIERLLRFGAAWQATAPILFHCHAGVSRSPAAAFILLCQTNDGREAAAAASLRRAGGHAWPNRRMVAIADRLLRRRGRMVEALRAMPPPDPTAPGALISLPARV